jgi:hypothetical protein
MVLSRGLVISLGVSALGCTLLFLYFRNKISAVERKVDVMFDLIQNHQQQNSMESRQYNEVIHEQQQEQQQQQTQGAWAEEPQQERNLIEVSDEDTDDDSDEVSDSESEDEENQPKISLEGIEDMSLEVTDVKKITVTESDKVEINDNIELEEVEDSLDEIDDDDEDEDEEEGQGGVVKKVTVVKEEEDEEFDYTKLKVSELKAIAEQKGLEGYKSLKKTPLIELLKASE